MHLVGFTIEIMKLILAMCINNVAHVSPLRNRVGSMIFMAAWIGFKYESCGSVFTNHKTFRGGRTGRTESCFILSQIFTFEGRNYTNSAGCSFQSSNCSRSNDQRFYIPSFHEPGRLVYCIYIYIYIYIYMKLAIGHC